MKLTNLLPNNETAIVSEIKIPDEYKLIDSFIPRIDGGKIFRMDRITKKICQVELRQATEDYHISNLPVKAKRDWSKGWNMGSAPKSVRLDKIDLEPGCNYVEAVNLKNATRKLLAGRFDFQTK